MSPSPLSTLPNELLLHIMESLPYSPGHLDNLRKAYPRANALYKDYERSIVKHILRTQRFNNLRDCPLARGRAPSFAYLAECERRYDNTEEILEVEPLSRAPFHNQQAVHRGLLHLYDLQGRCMYYITDLSPHLKQKDCSISNRVTSSQI